MEEFKKFSAVLLLIIILAWGLISTLSVRVVIYFPIPETASFSDITIALHWDKFIKRLVWLLNKSIPDSIEEHSTEFIMFVAVCLPDSALVFASCIVNLRGEVSPTSRPKSYNISKITNIVRIISRWKRKKRKGYNNDEN